MIAGPSAQARIPAARISGDFLQRIAQYGCSGRAQCRRPGRAPDCGPCTASMTSNTPVPSAGACRLRDAPVPPGSRARADADRATGPCWKEWEWRRRPRAAAASVISQRSRGEVQAVMIGPAQPRCACAARRCENAGRRPSTAVPCSSHNARHSARVPTAIVTQSSASPRGFVAVVRRHPQVVIAHRLRLAPVDRVFAAAPRAEHLHRFVHRNVDDIDPAPVRARWISAAWIVKSAEHARNRVGVTDSDLARIVARIAVDSVQSGLPADQGAIADVATVAGPVCP